MKRSYPTNRNSLRWFNEKYADLSAKELIEKYNKLFGKDKHKKKFVKRFRYSFWTNRIRHV